MIIRVSTEGQYELPESDRDTLNELDNQAVVACGTGDESAFEDAFERLLNFIRTNGRPVRESELAPSEVILPPPDTSLEEAKEEFTGEGLIPG